MKLLSFQRFDKLKDIERLKGFSASEYDGVCVMKSGLDGRVCSQYWRSGEAL